MRVITLISFVSTLACTVDGQFWKYPQSFMGQLWTRKGRTSNADVTTTLAITTLQKESESTERFEDGSSERSTSLRVENGTETVTASDGIFETSTQEMLTTEEPRDNHRLSEFYLTKREKPQIKIASNISQVSWNLKYLIVYQRFPKRH